jgi:hypothetical protein
MDHEQFDILLSAYLDGELTHEEQVRVEQLLASSSEARQLIEELRALRAGLQALPQHKLEPSFAECVLREAESQIQTSESAQPVAAGAVETAVTAENDKHIDTKGRESESASVEHAPSPKFWLNPRGLAWAAVATAIALMVTATSRRGEERQIAHGPPPAANMQAAKEGAAPTVPEMHAAASGDLPDSRLANNFTPNQPAGAFSTGGALAGAAAPEERKAKEAISEFGAQPGNNSLFFNESQAAGKNMDLTREAFGAKLSILDSDVLLVEVQVSPEAAARGDFDKLLAANEIQIEDRFADRAEGSRRLNMQGDDSAAGASADFGGAKINRADLAKDKDFDAASRSGQARGSRMVASEPPARKLDQTIEGEKLQVDADRNGRRVLERAKAGEDYYWFAGDTYFREAELRKLAESGATDVVIVEALPQQVTRTLKGLADAPNSFKLSTIDEAVQAGTPAESQSQNKSDSVIGLQLDVTNRGMDSKFSGGGRGEIVQRGRESLERLQKQESAGAAEQNAQRYADQLQSSTTSLGRAVRYRLPETTTDTLKKSLVVEKPTEASRPRQENAAQSPRGGSGGGGFGRSSGLSPATRSPSSTAIPTAPLTPAPAADAAAKPESTRPQLSDETKRYDSSGPAAAEGKATAIQSPQPDPRQKVVFLLRVADPAKNAAVSGPGAATAAPESRPAQVQPNSR